MFFMGSAAAVVGAALCSRAFVSAVGISGAAESSPKQNKIIVHLALLRQMRFGREVNFPNRPTNGLFYCVLFGHSCVSHIYSKSAPLFAMVCRCI